MQNHLRLRHEPGQEPELFEFPDESAWDLDSKAFDALFTDTMAWCHEHMGKPAKKGEKGNWQYLPPAYGQGDFIPAAILIRDAQMAFAFKMRFC